MDPETAPIPHGRLALIALMVALIGAFLVWRYNAPPATAPGSPVAPAAGPETPSAMTAGPTASAAAEAAGTAVERLRPEVLASHPHDPQAFTQGLVWHAGQLYESTGLNGRSSLRRVALTSGEVAQQVDVPEQFFAEGLALVGDRLYQLTWQSHAGFIYDLADFSPEGGFTYDGEGWGLCYDGERLVRSDGSADLIFHDPQDFAETGRVTVTLGGAAQERINELECVDDAVYANVWQTDRILRIDPRTGAVTAEIDAAGLLTAEERAAADVLNGIAYDPEGQRFYITGKLWPKLFAVRFAP